MVQNRPNYIRHHLVVAKNENTRRNPSRHRNLHADMPMVNPTGQISLSPAAPAKHQILASLMPWMTLDTLGGRPIKDTGISMFPFFLGELCIIRKCHQRVKAFFLFLTNSGFSCSTNLGILQIINPWSEMLEVNQPKDGKPHLSGNNTSHQEMLTMNRNFDSSFLHSSQIRWTHCYFCSLNIQSNNSKAHM